MTQPTRRGDARTAPDPVPAPTPAPLAVDHHLRLELAVPEDPRAVTLDQLEARLGAARAAGVPGTAYVSTERGYIVALFLDWTAPPARRGRRWRLR